jgi:pimeloyl-ACP methyl ester carboxylesterase
LFTSLASLVVLFGFVLAVWYLDKMALSFLTGQRRVPGKDWFGQEVRMEGPPPGYLFLGFSRPSDDPKGFEITRPADSGIQAGLKNGDVVVSVEGKCYQSSFDLISSLLAERNAGDQAVVKVRRGTEELQLQMELETFYRSPSDLGLDYEELEIESGSGCKLQGWYLPAGPDGDGRTVVFVHGATSSRFQALDGAPYWHRRGYGLLAMDLSGRGESEGNYVTFTMNERKDVRSMVESISKRPDVDEEKIVVFGSSNGAASAIYAAAEMPKLAALVLDAPYSDLWAEGVEMLSTRGVPSGLLHLLNWAVWLRAGLDLTKVKPLEVIAAFSKPVLFIHGDSDTQILPYHSEVLHQTRLRAGLPSRWWVIEGGEHGFDNYPPPEIFWNQVIDFCDQQLPNARWLVKQ